MKRNFLENFSLHNPFFFQLLQAQGQRSWADAVKRAPKLAKAPDPIAKVADDENCPFCADDF